MTATILLFSRHRLHSVHSCLDPECRVCLGGLSLCETCSGAEGAMPTDCPQEPMTYRQTQAVYDGEVDFVRGRWVPLHTPTVSGRSQLGLPADTFPEHPLLHYNCRCTLHPADPDAG